MAKHNRLTVKGQVTIPKDVRDALGVMAGDAVTFEHNDQGDVVVRKATIDADERERRFQAALAAIREARKTFPPVPLGMSTDDYMASIREPVPLP